LARESVCTRASDVSHKINNDRQYYSLASWLNNKFITLSSLSLLSSLFESRSSSNRFYPSKDVESSDLEIDFSKRWKILLNTLPDEFEKAAYQPKTKDFMFIFIWRILLLKVQQIDIARRFFNFKQMILPIMINRIEDNILFSIA
jgi:hypothetical protein